MADRKNQLNSSWSLWYERRKDVTEEEEEWGSQQKKLASFSSVEEFWGIYNRILPVSKLQPNCMYHFFKDGIQPSWEDNENVNGGSWRFVIRPTDLLLEEKWLTFVLSAIGEQVDPQGSSVCGISMVMKPKGARVEVWVKDAEDKLSVAAIGRGIRKLNIVEVKENIEFRKHGGDVIYQL